MPLPTKPTAWPPKQLQNITPKLDTWLAWWVGDPAALTALYSGGNARARTRPSQHAGGVVGALSRFWWGRPASDGQVRDQTHVPIAADLARTSADLLFAEPPTIKSDDADTQKRLDDVVTDPLLATLTGAAESAAALGGVYLRVTWDQTVADSAFITTVNADQAVPEFTWDKLTAVTFWTVVARDGQTVWRHLERHETDDAGIGLVQHGLYEGAAGELGHAVPLTEQPATKGLAESIDDHGYLTSGRTPGLAVAYVPNVTPGAARAWVRTPAARGLGASDFDGVEALMDDLDEIQSSWKRDIRLARARLLVARHMLDDNGPGLGAGFDMDREVFSPLKMAPGEDKEAPITPVQFAIRFEEHRESAKAWTDRIIRTSGYSLETFGDWDSSQMTATEVTSRETRTMTTRGRKIRAWRPALAAIIAKLLAVDSDVFGRPTPGDIKVTFPDGIVESPLQVAQTAAALRTAEAASTEALVALVNPGKDEPWVKDEAARILAERGATADPFQIGR